MSCSALTKGLLTPLRILNTGVKPVSQTQIPNPVTQPETQVANQVILKYDTWGSFGQFSKDIAILRNGAVVDPSKLYIKNIKGARAIHNINGIQVVIENRDSNKNYHRIAYVPADAVVAIINFTKTSSKMRESVVYGNGEVVHETITDEKVDGHYRIIRMIERTFYVGSGLKILLGEEIINTKKELIAKPRVIITRQEKYVVISGDTYHVRETLKAFGCKYDGVLKKWFLYDTLKLEDLIKELEQVAEVIQR